MNRLLEIVALVGFALSLATHVAALMGIDVFTRVPWIWLLHAGVFVVCVPVVFSIRKVFGRRPTLAALRAAYPDWLIALVVFAFGYAAVNFLLFALATEGASPAVRDGRFVLQSHGRFIRELSLAQYTAFKANEARGLSGHWMAFYFVAFVYLVVPRRGIAAPGPMPGRDATIGVIER